MNLGQKIEQLLKVTAMTKVELSKKLGLKDSSVVSHWVKNRFKPDRNNVRKLSAVFDKPVSYFTDDDFTYTPQTAEEEAAAEKKLYELLSSLPAGRPVGVLGDIKQEIFPFSYYAQAEEYLPIMLENKQRQPFALKVADKSACPWANNGEYLIFCQAEQVHDGKLALVKIDDFFTIKKVFYTPKKILLENYNKETKRYNREEAEVIALLLAFYRKP